MVPQHFVNWWLQLIIQHGVLWVTLERATQGDNYPSCATDKMVGKKPITAVLWRYFTESTEGQTVATRSRRAVVDVELARDSRVALETRAAVARLIGAQSGQNRRTDTAVKTRIVLYTAHTSFYSEHVLFLETELIQSAIR